MKEFTDKNREAWEQVAPIHAKHNQETLIESFQDPDFTVLNDVESDVLNTLDVEGKDVAQVCCNNGRELICVKRMGAGRCVGFDGALGFVQQADELADAALSDEERAEIDFVCTDIYDIGPEHDESFDIVTITIGVISWMPNLQDFFNVLARIMRPGGALFIYEHHPVLEMMFVGGPEDPVDFELSYFDKQPYVDESGLDYYQREQYDAKPTVSFLHTMAEIIMAGVNSGLNVEHFVERPEHISNTWFNVEKQVDGFPMSYTLVFRKPA